MKVAETTHTSTTAKANDTAQQQAFFRQAEGSFFSDAEAEPAFFNAQRSAASPAVQAKPASTNVPAAPVTSPAAAQSAPVTSPAVAQSAPAVPEKAIQEKEDDNALESTLSSTKGSGSALPEDTRAQMESAIGSDFSAVRVHTGSSATQMNKDLGAQAFTHGNDIYFNSGKYDTGSKDGKQLLAHELTHVVQQNGMVSPKAEAAGVPSIQLWSLSGALDSVEDAVSDAASTVADVASDAAGAVKDAAVSAAGAVKDAANTAIDAVKDAASWIYDKIKGLVDDGVEWLKEKWNDLQQFGAEGLQTITNFFNGILNFIKNPIKFIGDAITNFDADSLEAAFNSLTSIAQTLWQNFSMLGNTLLSAVNGLWGTISGFANSLFSKIDSLMDNVLFNHLPDVLQNAARKLVDFVRGVWKNIDDVFKALLDRITSFIRKASKAVEDFIGKIMSFAIGKIVSTIRFFAALVPTMLDFFKNPDKYLHPLGERIVGFLQGVEGKMGAQINKYFGGGGEKTAAAAPTIMKKDEPGAAAAPARSTATWSQIGNGVWDVMKQKWAEFKKNPLSIVIGMLMDLFIPMVGNVKDIIKLYDDIKKIVTKPLGASTLEEAWTSFLQLLDIPILIYSTITSILGRTLLLPLLVASFIPHPIVKGIAAAVGYELLSMFVESELLNIGHKLLLLKTGANTADEKKDAYNRVGDSIVALIVAGIFALIMLIISIGAQIARGVFNFVSGKFFTPKEVPIPEGKGPTELPGEKGPADNKGPGDTDPNAPKGESDKIKAETRSDDQKRTIEVDGEDGCKVCASPCDEIKSKYKLEIKNNPDKNFNQRIDAIRDDPKLSPEQKAEAYKAIDKELADIRENSEIKPEQTELDAETETTQIDPSEAKPDPKPGEPGSPEHKAQRWADYQKRTGGKGWDYDRWSKQYDINMKQALRGNAAADAYHDTLGWGEREVTVDVEGEPRRLDVGDVATKRGVEYKTGKVYASQEILWEVARDEILVKDMGWDIEWVFEETPSQPLLNALKKATLKIRILGT